jgi:hypothetical protein
MCQKNTFFTSVLPEHFRQKTWVFSSQTYFFIDFSLKTQGFKQNGTHFSAQCFSNVCALLSTNFLTSTAFEL